MRAPVWEGISVHVHAGSLGTEDAEISLYTDAMAVVARRDFGVMRGESQFVFIDRSNPDDVVIRMTFEGPVAHSA